MGHEPSTSTYTQTGKPVVAFNQSAMQVADKTELHWGTTSDVLVEFVAAYTGPAGGTFFNKLGAVFADAGNDRFGLIAANPIVDATEVWMSLDHGGVFGLADTTTTQDGKMRLYAVRRTSNGLTLSIRVNGVQSVTRNLSSAVNIDSVGVSHRHRRHRRSPGRGHHRSLRRDHHRLGHDHRARAGLAGRVPPDEVAALS